MSEVLKSTSVQMPLGYEKIDNIEIVSQQSGGLRFNGLIELGEGENKIERRVLLPDLAEMWGYKSAETGQGYDPEKDQMRQEIIDLKKRLDKLEKEKFPMPQTSAVAAPDFGPANETVSESDPYLTAGLNTVSVKRNGATTSGYIPVSRTKDENNRDMVVLKNPRTGEYSLAYPNQLVSESKSLPPREGHQRYYVDQNYRIRNNWLTRRRYGYRDVPGEVDYIYTDPDNGRPYWIDDEEKIYISERKGAGTMAVVAGAIALLGIGYIAREVEENEHNIANLQHGQVAEPSEIVVVNGKRVSLDRQAIVQIQRLLKFDKASARNDARRDWKIFKAERAFINQKFTGLQNVMTRQHIHDHFHELRAIKGYDDPNTPANQKIRSRYFFFGNKSSK